MAKYKHTREKIINDYKLDAHGDDLAGRLAADLLAKEESKPVGVCKVCGGSGFLRHYFSGQNTTGEPCPSCSKSKPVELPEIEKLKMNGGNGCDEAPHYIWNNKVGDKINELCDRLNFLTKGR